MPRMIMSLFQTGRFALHSGKPSDWKIECDALMDEDWETLALIGSRMVPQFTMVVPVMRGGAVFAEKLCRYLRPPEHGFANECILIVDDVLTTGESMDRTKADLQSIYVSVPILGLVAFARGACPDWVTPIFQVGKEL